jgi:hypothetical protein
MAYKKIDDVYFEEEEQEEYFQLFLEYYRERHPNGVGIGDGFSDETLFSLAREIGFQDMDEFRDDILDVYTRNEHLISLGTPYYDRDSGRFIRRPQPYVPSLSFMIRAFRG